MPRDFNSAEVNDGVATLQGVEAIVENITRVALGFGGLAVFIMLLIGGFKYLTSGGDPKAVEAAKQTLTMAVIGMIILACAFLILRFISVFTGQEQILNFVVTNR